MTALRIFLSVWFSIDFVSLMALIFAWDWLAFDYELPEGDAE